MNSQPRVLSLPGSNYQSNPYFRLFCEGLEKAGIEVVNVHDSGAKWMRFDILHIHFPEHHVTQRSFTGAVLSSIIYLALLACAKMFRKTIVWTVHDVVPFNLRHLWLLWPYLFLVRKAVNGYVFMNPSSRKEFNERFPHERHKLHCSIPLGPYPSTRISGEARRELRAKLSANEDCLLVGFLGDIKPYKNINALSKLPERTGDGRRVKIVVAGRADPPSYAPAVDAILNSIGPSRIVRLDERITDARLSELIQSVDVVFLPYERGSNSAFAMLVLSCGGRIVSSKLALFHDLEAKLGKFWVHSLPLDAQIDSLDCMLAGGVEKEQIRRRDTFLEESSFLHGALTVKSFYLELLTSRYHKRRAEIAADL